MGYRKQLQLAIDISKKLFFDYQKFSIENNWGDADLLMDAIQIAVKALNENADESIVNGILPKIDLVSPDMDDFGTCDGSYALNASSAIYETLQFIIDKDQTHIYNIATYYTDTVDIRIQEDDTLTNDETDRHPLMMEVRNYLIEKIK